MRKEHNTTHDDLALQRSSRGLPSLPGLGEHLTNRAGLLFFKHRINQPQTVDALIAHVLQRDIEPLGDLLESSQPASVAISEIQANYLKNLDRLYIAENNQHQLISKTPIFLALVLLHESDPLSVKSEQPSEIVTALLKDQEKLYRYATAALLNHPSQEEIEAFAGSLKKGNRPNELVQTVLALALHSESDTPTLHAPMAP
ncbi:MAG: hypothetical protein A3F41_00820 [Coxiella sp. RIFCSPHIGHO2_12_FULL_44_14]|nr:MAG: hypothetical protein A3F41_00820 [Coxiella sp. RIFCSPHIGHO2_12_FULL_44_14]